MPLLEQMIGDIPSSVALIDPDAVSEAGLLVMPPLPPLHYDGYQASAIVADVSAGRWLGREALGPLLADDTTPAGAVIEVVSRMSSELRAAMDSYPRGAIGPDGIGEPTLALQKAASTIGGKALRVTVAKPGMANTTIVPLDSDFAGRGLRAGAHIDNQDHQPLAKRAESRRRFIPSRGPGDRMSAVWFPDIVTVGYIMDFPEDKEPGYDIYLDYLRRYPYGAVCVGIPIGPYQGSLANTDLIIHDGMTLGAADESMTFQILGNWERKELASIGSSDSCYN